MGVTVSHQVCCCLGHLGYSQEGIVSQPEPLKGTAVSLPLRQSSSSFLIPHRGLRSPLLIEPGTPSLISGSEAVGESIFYPEVWEHTAQPGQLMGLRVPPTFILHKLASILSCSTILRACPILIVLFTGVSPFILEKREGSSEQSQLQAPSMLTHPALMRPRPYAPIFCFLIPILQGTFPSPSSSAEEMERGWDEMLPKLTQSLGHRSLNIQII